MSRAIICLVFVIVLSSTSDGRLIDKRSSGGSSDFGDQIIKAGDFDSDAIQSAIQLAMEEKLKKVFANSDTVRNVRSTKIKDTFSKDAFSKDAFVDAESAIGDFFGNLRKKKRSPGYNPNLGGQIKKAGDFDSDVIRSAFQELISSRVSKARGQTFSDVRDFGSKLY